MKEIKKQYHEYICEFQATEEMDIEKHINMALNIGKLLDEIDTLKKRINKVLEKSAVEWINKTLKGEETLKWYGDKKEDLP